MEKLKLPDGWIGVIGAPRWKKPYGLFSRNQRRILVTVPKWIPPWFGLRARFETIIWNHEVLHAWGNPGCSKVWCLGLEIDDGWREILCMPIQLIAGLRFCEECMSHYGGNNA